MPELHHRRALLLAGLAWGTAGLVVAATLTPPPVERPRLRLELPADGSGLIALAADRLAVLALAGEIGGRGAP